MSLESIIENIQNNILDRTGSKDVLRALELITRMPVTFQTVVETGTFFGTHHSVHAGCPNEEDCCDDCYSGDTECDYRCDLIDAAGALFKHMVTPESEDSEEGEESSDETSDVTEPVVEQLPSYHPSMGFKTPVLMKDNLTGFFREAELGPADPSNPKSEPVGDHLFMNESGISSRALLTPLFNVYVRVNKMQRDPHNKVLLTATPLMHKWFGDTFKELQNKIDPNRMRFTDLQIIISRNLVKRADLTEEQRDMMYNEEVYKSLDADHELVGKALNYYRNLRKVTSHPIPTKTPPPFPAVPDLPSLPYVSDDL